MIKIGDDLVDEILVRLPAKSLLRFKCVVKKWNDLFRKPTFANRNMKMHDKKKRLLICERHKPPHVMITENDEIFDMKWNPFPDGSVACPMAFCAAYNGVIFIDSIKFYLWNPTTREVKNIIPPPFLDPPPPSHTNAFTLCGFGGNPETTDFKVLFIVSIGKPIATQRYPTICHYESEYDNFNLRIDLSVLPITTFELYSLSTNSWTLLDLVLPVKHGSLTSSYGFFVNGVLHWISCKGTNDNKDCILGFDFRNNQFTTLDVPPYITIDLSNDILVDINESLAYVKKHDIPQNWTHFIVDIWTLEQDTCCWTKKYIFEPLISLTRVCLFWKDSPELLGWCKFDNAEEYLMSYHPDGHKMYNYHTQAILDDVVLKYVQSIAPLSFS